MIRTQLFIQGLELDLSQDINFPLTYSIADVKKPEKRKRNSSKTVKLPGTRKNSRFFSSAYDLHIVDIDTDTGFDFDPTIRYPARVKQDGIEVFRGSAHLTKVVSRDKQREFHIVLYSDLANLFQALGDLKVNELGWSEYDHDLTIANIEASWTPTLGEGYVYPYIDFGFASDPTQIKTNELFPYVFVKEIIEKCFAVADMTVTSSWIDSARIKKLIWGYAGGEQVNLSALEVSNRRATYDGDGLVSLSLNGFPSIGSTSVYNYIFDYGIYDNSPISVSVVTDTLSQFSETTGLLTVSNNGSYKLNITATCPVTYAYTPAQSNEAYHIFVILQIFKNQALIATQVQIISDTASGADTFNFDLTHEMSANAGDQISAKFRVNTFGSQHEGIPTADLDFTFDLDSTLVWDFTALDLGLIDGDLVNVSRFVPDLKAADFMLDMITMFNLYMGDPDENSVVTLEPALDFYFETDDVDQWSEKIARGKETPIEIEPAANIEGKTYEFHWALDEDYYKTLYREVYGHQYGDYDYEVPSTFKKGEKKYHLKTAQSVPVQLEGTDIIVPRIVKLNDSNLQTVPHKGKPRMFFYNGLVATTSGWGLINSDTGAVTAETEVPQAHHLDDLTTPTFDLNFGVPQWVYYTATAYTTSNLFQVYHSRFIRELTSRDSKIVNAVFNIKQTDLYEGFLRRLKNIDGVLYRVNIVKDYLANTHKLTKIELVKIIEAASIPTFSPTVVPDAKLPALGYGGDSDETGDFKARSSQDMYKLDTSGGDIDVELPADDLRPGAKLNFKKTTAPGKMILTPSGGGAGGSSIDGQSSLSFGTKHTNVSVYFDGTNFFVI